MAACVRELVAGCRFVFPADLSVSQAQDWLTTLRAGRAPIPVPDRNEFTRAEVADVLGVKPGAVTALLTRHRLAAEGKGKARRYPRATVEALARSRARGASFGTANRYLTAARAFGRWLVRDRRLPENPLAHLRGGDAERDRRRERRVLTADEVRQLIDAAHKSKKSFRGLAGPDRAVAYAVAVYTGYRAGELAELTPESFDLDGVTPVVRLAGSKTKNRKPAVQAVPPELAESLRGYLTGRPTSRPVWPGTWAEKAADMIRADLEAAGVPFTVAGADGRPLVADFHVLRHTCGVLAEAGGATLREVMTLMRHSDPKLTMRIYGRLQVHDLAETVRAMPSVLPVPTAGADSLAPDLAPPPDGSSGRLMVGEGGEGVGEWPEDVIVPGVDGKRGPGMAQEVSAPRRTRTYNPLIKSQGPGSGRGTGKRRVFPALSTTTGEPSCVPFVARFTPFRTPSQEFSDKSDTGMNGSGATSTRRLTGASVAGTIAQSAIGSRRIRLPPRGRPGPVRALAVAPRRGPRAWAGRGVLPLHASGEDPAPPRPAGVRPRPIARGVLDRRGCLTPLTGWDGRRPAPRTRTTGRT